MSAALLVVARLVAGCGGEATGERTCRVETDIVAGKNDNGDSSVVALERSGIVYCSATLIASDLAVTAAHCVTPPPEHVLVGALPHGAARLPVQSATAHPRFDATTLDYDIAVVRLQAPASGATLSAVEDTNTAIVAGTLVTVIGFGAASLTEPVTTRRRRSGVSAITDVSAASFAGSPAPGGPCGGDSGGAALANVGGYLVLVGVVSSGNGACDGPAYFTRVDAARAELIDPALKETAPAKSHCSAPGQE